MEIHPPEQKEEMDALIANTNTDKSDPKGSKFSKLRLRAIGGKKKETLKWRKVKGADGYVLYGAKCGKPMKRIAMVKSKKSKYVQKKLKKGTYYKYIIVAYKNIDGTKYVTDISKSAHAVTKGKKFGNAKKVTCKNIKVKVKKKKALKPKYTLEKKGKIHIAKFRYESSNTKIATVNKKGKIKGKKKGKCYIYVYAQNGFYKKVKVTVK